MKRIHRIVGGTVCIMAAAFAITRFVNMVSLDPWEVGFTRRLLLGQYLGFVVVFPLVALRTDRLSIRTMTLASIALVAYMVTVWRYASLSVVEFAFYASIMATLAFATDLFGRLAKLAERFDLWFAKKY